MKILLTGASGGIGREIAARLAHDGCTLALHFSSGRGAIDDVIARLPGSGHVAVQGDLAQSAAAARTWNEAATAMGGIDVLINNAGIYLDHPPLTSTPAVWDDAWQRTLGVNLLGPARLAHLAAAHMAARGGGRIVNISSRGAFRGEPTAPAYAASKAALNAFGQSMAKALAPSGVLVFTVAPGWVENTRTREKVSNPAVLADQPLGRVANPAEIADVVAYCALRAPASMTGAIIDVNGASYLRT